MCNVQKLIDACSKINAKREGRIIPNFKDTLNATIKVCSGDRDEIDNIVREVEKFNNKTKN